MDPGPQNLCSGGDITKYKTGLYCQPQTEDNPSHSQKPTLSRSGGNLFPTCPSLFRLSSRQVDPREAASVYPYSYLQPERHLFPHAGHLLSCLKVEERSLLSRAAYLPLAPGGVGPFHPCGGNLVLLLTPVSSLTCSSQPHLGTAPWLAKATELWSLFSGPTQQLPETQLILLLDTMPSEKTAYVWESWSVPIRFLLVLSDHQFASPLELAGNVKPASPSTMRLEEGKE